MTLKIGDFGLVRGDAENMRTQLGSEPYMAPELWEDSKFTSKIDIWAMGCILHLMLTKS